MAELVRRYLVLRRATDAPFNARDPEAPFVLKPWKDPAALAALKTYRDHCYPALARDLEAWIRLIEAGPVVRGDVGRRNERYAVPHERVRASRLARPRTAVRPAVRRRRGPSRPR